MALRFPVMEFLNCNFFSKRLSKISKKQNLSGAKSKMRKTKRFINILLSRHFDRPSSFIYYLTGKGFTHASIGLGEDKDTFYSFSTKGFRIERPNNWRKKDNRIYGTVYSIKVTEFVYQKAKKFIYLIKANQKKYKYNLMGLILAMMHIPSKIKNAFFCSQFVAEALRISKMIPATVPSSKILPNKIYDLIKAKAYAKREY